MQSKNNFDLSLSRYRGLPDQYAGKDVGIEIELEGLLKNLNNMYWSVKADGSLRDGGMEYVFKHPVAYAEVPTVLDMFQKCMDMCHPKATIRCSTHMHINVMSFSLREIYNVMAAYYLVESLLVQTQSSNRQGNLFCLRMQDAEDIFLSIRDSLTSHAYVGEFIVDRNRYAAMNLAALNKFGSLEFRFLDAITTSSGLQFWVDVFYHLVHNGRKLTPEKLLQRYDELSPTEFLAQLIPAKHVTTLVQGLSENAINRLLHTNYDYVFELCELLKAKKYTVPKRYWNEDLDGEERPPEFGYINPASDEQIMAVLAAIPPVWPAAGTLHPTAPGPWPGAGAAVPSTVIHDEVSLDEINHDFDFDPDDENL